MANRWLLSLAILLIVSFTNQQINNYSCDEKDCELDLAINATLCDRESGNCSCVCLNAVPQRYGGCWASDQCQYPGSRCLSPSGQSLDFIDLIEWNLAEELNGLKVPSPGTCDCYSRFWHDDTRNACIRRTIDARCRTHYQCTARVAHSSCQQRRCKCAHDYEYEEENDSCPRILEVNHTDEVCIGDRCSLVHEANMMGMVFCLCATIFFFWCCHCCCSCCRGTDTEKTPEEVYLGKDSY